MMVTGWDVGGVNTKAARVDRGRVCAVRVRPYELQRDPGRLADVLATLAGEIGAPIDAGMHCGITMTAELSQMFRTKREGVAFVLDAVERAFTGSSLRVFQADGTFVAPETARRAPLAVAAANWAATARVVAAHHPDALLLDVGTTTTDIIPIAGGCVCAEGKSDPERLASGELVYSGVVRTPAEALSHAVPLAGRLAGVSAEGFALAGDVHLWRGDLDQSDYAWPTPDGRPATRAFAGERLARVVCADRELIDERGVDAIADALADAQASRIAAAIVRVVARHPAIRSAVVTGLGAFVAARAARQAGLAVLPLAAELGAPAAHCAPAACVALLLERDVRDGPERRDPLVSASGCGRDANGRSDARTGVRRTTAPTSTPLLVVKLGGGVLHHPAHFAAALQAIARTARARHVLVVPGGGPFADTVRDIGAGIDLSEAAAHWMAIMAMDQYACLVASRLPDAVVARDRRGIGNVLASGQVPVLAPFEWLREADPLPHSWDVTSDSIAAWVAGQLGAAELLLIKPPGAQGDSVVDPYFARALPPRISVSVMPADRLEGALGSMVDGR